MRVTSKESGLQMHQLRSIQQAQLNGVASASKQRLSTPKAHRQAIAMQHDCGLQGLLGPGPLGQQVWYIKQLQLEDTLWPGRINGVHKDCR